VDNTFIILPGGTERQESVSLGLDALDTTTDVCVIHDAARPFVLPESVSDSVVAAAQFGGATVAIPSTDTILEADADRNLSFTPERSRLWQCQTPQTFRISVINRAHQWGRDHGIAVTDDATLVKLSGGTVRLVMGSESNFKITSAMDLQRAEWMIAQGLV
jgi:2-C-methyl-D-erythritol 4-phosphate cytidylyltransferase